MRELDQDYGWNDASEDPSHGYLLAGVRALLPSTRGLSILDAGCGNGYLSARYAELGHDVTALDGSRDGLDHARRAHPGVRFVQGSLYDDLREHCPSADGFDVVVATEVVEHLFAPRRFLGNAFRALRPGGTLVLSTPYHGYLKNLAISLAGGWDHHHGVGWEGGHIKFFSKRTLAAMVAASGFEAVTFRGAGRLPLLWKSMVCRACRPARGPAQERGPELPMTHGLPDQTNPLRVPQDGRA